MRLWNKKRNNLWLNNEFYSQFEVSFHIFISIIDMIKHITYNIVGKNFMPVIARFYNIIVKLYYIEEEHNPPHIHARYNEYEGIFNIATGE